MVIANVNSNTQSVIGGASAAVDKATQIFLQAGYNVVELSVSHAFHTSIVAAASEPLREMMGRLRLQSPPIPIVANVDGEFYPTGTDVVPKMIDLLAQQVAAPVQFVKGLRTLYEAGARVFVEVGPKKALQGFAEDVLGGAPDVFSRTFRSHFGLAPRESRQQFTREQLRRFRPELDQQLADPGVLQDLHDPAVDRVSAADDDRGRLFEIVPVLGVA